MNFWPSDEKAFYYEAAIRVPHLQYLSQIHETVDKEKIRWLHGKEIMILGISWMQRLMNDFDTIRPFILLGIIAIFFSGVLIYLIARRYWGTRIALFCYVIFATSLWPYMYILFAKHQTVGLFLFLMAFFSMLAAQRRPQWAPGFYFLSGINLGLSFFASTVSSLYFPYYIAGFCYEIIKSRPYSVKEWRTVLRDMIIPGVTIIAGMIGVFIYVNWPDVVHNIKSFVEYVGISGAFNHFYYAQPALQQWFPLQNVAYIRGGGEWIVKYFFVIMPVLLPGYLFAIVYLIVRSIKAKSPVSRLQMAGMIFLSVSAPLMAEIAQVAQYGANYFPAIVGIIMLVGYAIHVDRRDGLLAVFGQSGQERKITLKKSLAVIGLTLIMTAHIGINFYNFATDVYPCRMATTLLSRKLKELKIQKLYVHENQPHLQYFIFHLNPDMMKTVRFIPIKYIIQPDNSYILLPTITGDSIYTAATSSYVHYSNDVFLAELVRKGRLANYSLTSFKTLANSRLWLHEEEILTYRNLILNHQFEDNDLLGRVWLLDAKKIVDNQRFNAPIASDLDMHLHGIRNIGTKRKFFLYEGYTGKFTTPTKLSFVMANIAKVGDPKDALQVYVYKVAKDQNVWVPYGKRFVSQALPAEKILSDGFQGLSAFSLNPPMPLERGSYFFMIYRTGKPDDKNYYRIVKSYLGTI